MTRRILYTILIALYCTSTYAGKHKVQVYLGLRAGGGGMISRDKVGSFNAPSYVIQHHETWTLHAKGEALLGVGRLRIGYQFLYNFSGPQVGAAANFFNGDNNRNTTYYNSSQTHFFGHYLLVELAVINKAHFALTPGVGVGTFTGFKVDNNTSAYVNLGQDTHNKFSISAELNAEIKFGRVVFLVGPNYYMFSMQDRANSNWTEYQHFIGADVGLRVNLLKP